MRDYLRNVRENFQREPQSGASPSSTPSMADASDDKSTSNTPKWALRGDLPSDKLFVPEQCLDTLASSVFRPHDKLSGIVTARHGALGTPGGYSVVKATLHAHVRLVQTSKKGSYLGNVIYADNAMIPVSSSYDIDTFENRVIDVAEVTIYSFAAERMKQGKEVNLPFQIAVPPEADGFELAPSLTDYMSVALRGIKRNGV